MPYEVYVNNDSSEDKLFHQFVDQGDCSVLLPDVSTGELLHFSLRCDDFGDGHAEWFDLSGRCDGVISRDELGAPVSSSTVDHASIYEVNDSLGNQARIVAKYLPGWQIHQINGEIVIPFGLRFPQ